jgi:hypothetical protein
MLPILAAHLEDNETGMGLNKSLLSGIKVHLLSLKEELSRYFPDMSNKLCISFGQITLHIWRC